MNDLIIKSYEVHAVEKVSAKSGKPYYALDIVDTKTGNTIKSVLLSVLEYEGITLNERVSK